MSLPTWVIYGLILVFLLTLCEGDVMVQLNVNRPFNDVNEKFVSFVVKPEDLYKALDGPNRKSLTRMASILGDSYVKFAGDYYFSSETKLRNPTKIIWKGFNRWTRAVNWTMIIPVPYKPNNWDPMPALKILNSSHLIGVTDCIWQLGTDFGSSRALDYVTELKTFNLMVESFAPYVDDWQIMGADVSAGSSAEETRRYVEMSKDINAAFGWTEPSDQSNSINENDPALKILLTKKVPVWYSLPQKSKNRSKSKLSGRFSVEEVKEALRWAQIMGDAASTGFDAIFKKLTLTDLESPSFDFYVTALFKKVMGSRVFPSRPLNIFSRANKLYTHCANAVSGGIAFMAVNTGEKPLQISLRSMTKIADSEVWQYTLTYKNGFAMLNGEKLSLNSTWTPQIKIKSVDKPVLLSTPGMSVSFWVLPNVNLEHCQYTEIEAGEVKKRSDEEVSAKRYSSSDKLLQKLIQENSMVHGALSRAINRRRRYATFADRPKRFILENLKENTQELANILKPLLFDDVSPKKREAKPQETREVILDWIRTIMDQINIEDMPLLKRSARSADNYFGPYFATRDGKKTGITRKITEIKKPERKSKPALSLKEFDEEEFFKKISDQDEMEYTRLPEGDIHLKHITNTEGEDVDDYNEERRKVIVKTKKKAKQESEPMNEMRPLRLLPTEFYEALPITAFKPMSNKMNIGSTLNSLLFPQPFSKKKVQGNRKLQSKHEDEPHSDSISEVEEVGTGKFHKNGQLAQDFLRAQKELSKNFLSDQQSEQLRDNDEGEHYTRRLGDKSFGMDAATPKYMEYLGENNDNYFGDNEEHEIVEKPTARETDHKLNAFDEIPWWHMSSMRQKRSLRFELPDDAWQSNSITKDEIITPLGDSPIRFEYRVENTGTNPEDGEVKMPKSLVATVKTSVSKFVDIVTRHVSNWYNTLSKHLDADAATTSNVGNNIR